MGGASLTLAGLVVGESVGGWTRRTSLFGPRGLSATGSHAFPVNRTAASIGLINSFGNLGGWAGPSLVGVLKDRTDSYSVALWTLAGSIAVAGLIVASLGVGRKRHSSKDGSSF